MVIPGNFSFPLWVLSWECPPNLEVKDKSKPKESINHLIAGPDSLHKVLIISVGLALGSPNWEDLVVSAMNSAALSLAPFPI